MKLAPQKEKEGSIILHGKKYHYQTYLPSRAIKSNGLWRMLRIHDPRGNVIITIYNDLKESLRNIIISSLRDRNLLPHP